MKKNILLAIALLCFIGFASCKDNGSVGFLSEPQQITGTKWYLIGYFDVEKNEFIEANPSPTLYFDTDTTAYGTTLCNTLHYEIQGNKIKRILMSWVGDAHNGNLKLFYDALKSLETFKIENDKLIIYYDSYKKYLLYGVPNDW